MPRRALLAGALAGVLGAALAGCSGADVLSEQRAAATSALLTPSAVPTGPDAAPVTRARASASLLMVTAERLARSRPEPARLLGDVAAAHRAHLAALGAPVPPVASPSASGSPSPSRGQDRDLAAAVAAEHAAAGAALDDVQLASPLVAALLARIAAARAVHADLLAAAGDLPLPGEVAPATVRAPATQPARPVAPAAADPTPTIGGSSPDAGSPPGPLERGTGLESPAREALVALTAGEHAAVFAYGFVAGRARGRDRALARDGWAWHLARRDQLEERLLEAGVQPPAAAPAYDLGKASGASAAGQLAGRVEDRVARLAARAVAATAGQDRADAATSLVAAARRAARWRGRTTPLPG